MHAPIKRALLSVSDKTGIVELGRTLAELGVEILSTGGTARTLGEAGVRVRDVSDYTGFPEMMNGRVKTLHPRIYGGLLNLRDNPAHRADMEKNGVSDIDLVVANLYPFEKTVSDPGVALAEAVENIDIGGPCMIRAAAKNFEFVTVITDPTEIPELIAELRANGGTAREFRVRCAVKAFTRTREYDRAIGEYLERNAQL